LKDEFCKNKFIANQKEEKMSFEYDLTVIGAGPGGYVAAIRAAQLGMKVAVVEKRSTLGGTCLNVGCIPSKALLDSSEHYHNAHKNFAVHGIGLKDLSIDMKKFIKRKDDVVAQTTAGIDFLFKKNKIDRFEGIGSFVDDHTVKIEGKDTKNITSNKIMIATGSEVATLPFLPIDGKRVISSDHAINLQEIPKNFIVIGGGVIGLELGSVYARLGAKVHVIEYADSILPTMDKDLGKTLQRSLKKLGFKFHLSTKVNGIKTTENSVTVSAENKKGKAVEFTGDYVLVSIGRKPFTENLGLENIGLSVDEKGRIPINNHWQTSKPHIFAIGDVVVGPMLAHKAEEEGVAAVEFMVGQKPHVNYDVIPGVVYTWPEVAAVGKSEEFLKEKNIAYKVGNFPFRASGRARASEESDGFVKVLADAKTDEILGVHMLGPRAADMISEAVVAMEYRASAEDIGRIVHAHPTFTEALKEAALDATENRAIHI
jgi:dihydrolipoamide dehydrogenase